MPDPSVLLSLCMIVKNEAAFLERALASAEGAVDETIVVDTGSTDATPEIARAFGAQVHRHPWRHDFAEARNVSLALARGAWILVLDADEALTPDARDGLRPLLRGAEADAFELIRHDLAPPGEIQAYTELALTRLFRNDPGFRYEGAIHEQIRPSIERRGGRIDRTGLVILHYGYLQEHAQGGASRAARNLALLQEAVRQAPYDPYLHYQLGVTYNAMGRRQEAYEALQQALQHGAEAQLGPAVLGSLHMRLAQILLAGDRYAEAARQARNSLVHDPGNVISLYVAGLSHLFLHQPQSAYPFLRKARAHPRLRPEEAAQLDTLLAFCEQATGPGR